MPAGKGTYGKKVGRPKKKTGGSTTQKRSHKRRRKVRPKRYGR